MKKSIGFTGQGIYALTNLPSREIVPFPPRSLEIVPYPPQSLGSQSSGALAFLWPGIAILGLYLIFRNK